MKFFKIIMLSSFFLFTSCEQKELTPTTKDIKEVVIKNKNLTLENKERIQQRMPIAEIELLLGKASKKEQILNLPANQEVLKWENEKSWLIVSFTDGLVTGLKFSPDLMSESEKKMFAEYATKYAKENLKKN
jgi:hypothetical protein